jgi:steroid delta-isomerase-like uncharacterized protein
MTRDQVRRILQLHQDALNRHDVPTLAALYAPDAVVESPMFKTITGRAAIARSFERLFALFPDYTITMRDPLFICEGNRGAEFSTVTGTQSGELFGLPPARQPIEYHAARLFTFADGLITHENRIYDFVGVLERLEKTRLDDELTVASAVQQTLMSRTHRRGEFFEIVGASQPCRAIGGDFLDYRDLADGQLGLALGDVSGKGPAAALLAAMLQGMIAMLGDEARRPGEALARLNLALCDRAIEPRFATLFYGVVAPDGTLTYANAGHTPPLLVHGTEVVALEAGGPILGVFPTASFPAESVRLAPGDTIVVYSDGVTDANDPSGADFGIERLMVAARHLGSRPTQDVAAGLLESVSDFWATAGPSDDATVAAFRYRPGN